MFRFLSAAALVSLLALPHSAHSEMPASITQKALNVLNEANPEEAFHYAFEAGDELTEAVFTAERGAGAFVSEQARFTRYPRADLNGDGQWANHFPPREGGPQAQSCISCHSAPHANGAGPMAMNVAIDPLHMGDPANYLERNTLHIFALGGVQRVAEEMTAELKKIAARLGDRACAENTEQSAELVAKGVSFGEISVRPISAGQTCETVLDLERVEGVAPDLVIRPFGWKGTAATIREFSRGAAHNEMGLQAIELVGAEDGDFDGVTEELSVGDVTALTVYMAALERPTSRLELDRFGIQPLESSERARIEQGEKLFNRSGCAECHVPAMTVTDTVFSEPSAYEGYAETEMPSGQDAHGLGLDAATAIRFDLTKDQPNNVVTDAKGAARHLGSFERNSEGQAIIRWFSDFKRHDMGPALADPIDAYGFGASVWPTRSLAGVGSTGPWLHNGHATTLDEAILAHGGEAGDSRTRYQSLDQDGQNAVVAFLENLIIADLDAGAEH